MIYTFQYNTEEEKQNLINQEASKYLIEVQQLNTGMFLIFSDEPRPIEPIYIDVSQEELQNLKQHQTLIQTALDELILGGI